MAAALFFPFLRAFFLFFLSRRRRRRRRFGDFFPSLFNTFFAAALSLLDAMCLTRWEGLRDCTPEKPATLSFTRPPTIRTLADPFLLCEAPADLRRVTAGMYVLLLEGTEMPSKMLSCALLLVSKFTSGLLPPSPLVGPLRCTVPSRPSINVLSVLSVTDDWLPRAQRLSHRPLKIPAAKQCTGQCRGTTELFFPNVHTLNVRGTVA